MSYEDYVGLVQNRQRVLTQRSVAVLAAINAGGGDAPLDAGWADAVAEDESEVQEILAEANQQRARNRARAAAAARRGPLG